MDNKLIKIIEIEARKLADDYKLASIEGKGTPQEIADRREGYFIAFLAKYFPFPYRMVKGNIIDSFGNSSDSIDCIVLNPSHPFTVDSQNNKVSIIFADGVDFAIEIKPNLASEKELYRALDQIRSVKKLRRVRDGLLFRKRYSEIQREYAKTIPCFIVADKTYVKTRTLIEKITNYYVKNNIPSIEQFDYILVNNRFLVYNSRYGSYCCVNFNEDGNITNRKIAFWDGGSTSLAMFLFEMSRCLKSEPEISQNIMSIYLNNIPSHKLYYYNDLNELLINKKL